VADSCMLLHSAQSEAEPALRGILGTPGLDGFFCLAAHVVVRQTQSLELILSLNELKNVACSLSIREEARVEAKVKCLEVRKW